MARIFQPRKDESMKRIFIRVFFLLLLVVLQGSGCVGLGAAAVAGGIVYYKSTHHETASVNLQASPDRVYQAALETVAAQLGVEIVNQDKSSRLLELKQGKRNITLKVAALSPTLTQLHVTSDVHSGTPGSTQAVLNRVGEICDRLGVAHYVVK